MLKRLLLITTLGVMLSGCYMAPLALIGPATSGFSTASVMQSAVTSSASYLVKLETGKTIAEHAYDSVLGQQVEIITKEVLQQTYLPYSPDKPLIIAP